MVIWPGETTVTFETFELSPDNKAVYEAPGRLVRHFPANTIELPEDVVANSDFQKVLAKTIVKMSHQEMEEMKTKVKKALEMHNEDRETTHPRIVTELLASFLRGIGEQVSVPRIRKNTREEVIWRNSKMPWRRSPLWILIRVSLQLTMGRLTVCSGETYKSFMVFMLAKTMNIATQCSSTSEVLHTMSVKISRRLLKLERPLGGTWLEQVRRIMSQTSQCLDERWGKVRNVMEPRLDLATLAELNMSSDTFMNLPDMEAFISSILQRSSESQPSSFCPVTVIESQNAERLPTLSAIFQNTSPFKLITVESWVASYLDSWVDINLQGGYLCREISELMVRYHTSASLQYAALPEAASRMFLVLLELWIAADKIAVDAHPLLKEYDPQIPIEVYQANLLCFRQDMERLHRAESYILQRREHAAIYNRPSVLSSYGDPLSFPCQFFAQSPKHQGLMHIIEEKAKKERAEKTAEFHSLRGVYIDLMNRSNATECQQVHLTDEDGMSYYQHSASCNRCSLRNEAHRLSIQAHEWPLSPNRSEAQATVFELALPQAFGEWRDITLFLIDNVLRCDKTSMMPDRNSSYELRTYSALATYYASERIHRAQLLSATKPHMSTHRRGKTIAHTSLHEVLLNNGLKFQYYDGNKKLFLGTYTASFFQSQVCTFQLPTRSQSLQRFLIRDHTNPSGSKPNDVIAGQANCPDHMTLGEYKGLASMPYGYSIQWQNILAQLAMPSVHFNKPETAITLLQMILQAGPNERKEVERCTHAILVLDEMFAAEIHRRLEESVSRVKKNWESYTALWTFTFLATRLLSMSPVDSRPKFSILLSKCRNIAFEWLIGLRRKVDEMTAYNERADFLAIILDIALVCMESFNMEQTYLKEVLSDSSQLSIMVNTSVIIHDNTSGEKMPQGTIQPIMYDRWRNTLYRASTLLIEQVTLYSNQGLNLALQACWPDFIPAAGWRLSGSTSDWLETTSAQLKVHINVLTGELLVNGLPLARLPPNYETHDDYKKLFGKIILGVMPSSSPGMRFCSTKKIEGFTAHFGMESVSGLCPDENLLLRLDGVDTSLDLIPPRIFAGLLPDSFVKDYVHWYDHKAKAVQFRPVSNKWYDCPDSWTLNKYYPFGWRLSKTGNVCLLSPVSKSAHYISTLLSPLETELRIHMLYHDTQVLEIEIPRLGLDFSLADGDTALVSRQFRDMQVDANQSIGTLIGLSSRLILCKRGEPEDRVVIIPDGKVSYCASKEDSSMRHMSVTVGYGTARRVQRYSIDNHLRRLVDNSTLRSKLLLSYIHALTSYCLPDPFTGRTGTEEALFILGSASVRSPQCLQQDTADRLYDLALLTPTRTFYPSHEKVMQTVGWYEEMSFLSQDGRFYKTVKRIFEDTETMKFLYPDNDAKPEQLLHANMELLDREILRNSRQQVSGHGAEDFTTEHDSIYTSREIGLDPDRPARASEIACRIYRKHQVLRQPVSRGLANHLYDLLTVKNGSTEGFTRHLSEGALQYDSQWLRELQTFLPHYWCKIHKSFHGDQAWMTKFESMIWLSTVSYSKYNDEHVTQALLIIVLCGSDTDFTEPLGGDFELGEGYKFRKDYLRRITDDNLKKMNQAPAFRHIEALPGESGKKTQKRRGALYKSEQSSAVQSFLNLLEVQWPCTTPSHPNETSFKTYINVKQAMKLVSRAINTWYSNLQFQKYLGSFVSSLRKRPVEAMTVPTIFPRLDPPGTVRCAGFISINDIFSKPPPELQSSRNVADLHILIHEADTLSSNSGIKLTDILDLLKTNSKFGFEHQYIMELRDSLTELGENSGMALNRNWNVQLSSLLRIHLEACEADVKAMFNALSETLASAAIPDPLRDNGNGISCSTQRLNWGPRITPIFLLQQLGRDRWPCLSEVWKTAISQYGVAITRLHHARQLIKVQHNDVELLRELENTGHRGWDPQEYPEWLLLECESGITIREVQQQIARQMIYPPDNKNAVMQLNMGEGKSSVIVPIVTAALADGEQLVRVIVAKPQAKQMYQMLVSKLSGLLDRTIYQLPFSRAISMDETRANAIKSLVSRCKKEGGAMMVQPEHLLSFQLMGLECSISGDELAKRLLQIQQIFDSSTRDVVDESDENFSVKFELIYTIGLQQAIEGTPHRWATIQHILHLFSQSALGLWRDYPESLDIDITQAGRFPRTRILRSDAEEKILTSLARSICETGMTGFPLARQLPHIREAVFRYITKLDLSIDEKDALEKSRFWDETTIHYVLLLRGLMAGGILAFAFGQKRWRVDYGVDKNREVKTRLAVPFRAKDNPTPRSEFSHPDVVIVLTCLSYYYSGLENADIFMAFDILIRSDSPDVEYQTWVKNAPSLPGEYRQLIGINLRDRQRCKSDIFPHLRYSKGLIDYFLSQVVFAKECREFPYKLSLSGWNIAKKKNHPTTGFSGTNDSRYVLPLDIKQLDLPQQRHTNALVLGYLLRPENGVALMPQHIEGATLESRSLLEMVSDMDTNTRVILDVGAQIIDLDNIEFARKWLGESPDNTVEAVVFFNDNDDLMVLDRRGVVESLQTSPYANQLDRCFVFLDEAHTRGTDLRLPTNYRAVVTLGANLTKDRLVQGKMGSDLSRLQMR